MSVPPFPPLEKKADADESPAEAAAPEEAEKQEDQSDEVGDLLEKQV